MSFFTRKIFLDCLGTEFMGLNTTMGSVLGFLDMTELGVGAAISYTLYKPLADKNQEEINKIISILGYLYSKIGLIIIGLGVIVSLFFPWMFSDTNLSMGVIYFSFYSLLASSLLGYFMNYPSVVFNADQRGYEITKFSQGANVLRLILSVVIVKYTNNFYLYLSLNVIFGLVAALIIQWRVKKVYPWLSASIKNGWSYLKEYPSIITKTKQIFFHRIGSLGQYQLTPIIIYSFASLSSVALYGNYTIITHRLTSLIDSFIGSTNASVGNLVAQGDKNKIIKVYNEMLSMRFFIAGYVMFMLYMLAQPFITIWLGGEYLLSNAVLFIISMRIYIHLLRSATDQFIVGYGLFHDIWAPISEAIISVVSSIALGYFWGLPGVVMGGNIGLLTIVCIWRPYFLFKQGMNISVSIYWVGFARRFIIYAIASVAAFIIYKNYPLVEINNFFAFALAGVYLSAIFLLIYIPIQYILDSGFRDLANRTLSLIRK